MNPRVQRALVLTGLASLVWLAAGCGGSKSPGVAAVGSTTSATTTSAQLAFSRCMRSHGVPNFPDPDAQGNFPSFHAGISKQTSSAADEVCKHLLPSGGTGTSQQRQQKFTFALKVARCLRAHGYASFPDPTSSGERIPPEIDTQSPLFQKAETSCETQARKALGLP